MPETREIPLTRGLRCWIRIDYPAGAIPRLRPGAPALILNPSARDGLVEIEADGRRWMVAASDLDCGMEYLTKAGEWVSEGDPLFRDWAIRELREARPAAATSAATARRMKRLAHLLQRNGWVLPRWCR